MLTVSILINGQPLYTRSCYRETDGKDGINQYRVDDGSVIEHKYDDGAIELAHKLLDTMHDLRRQQVEKQIERFAEIIGEVKK